ncbi:DUF4181 domain-containing protein [Siminovitchia terrae]|uniref:DUF4181 domain-containing protein n=2 Tax=Siminovitchia terrae TaxID=1914933 RepID=UPI0028AFFB0A|nr:DUF4181 domain-containing protein [Siminovitchia terrae]
MKFLAIFIMLAIIWFILEKVMDRLLHLEKKKISETPGRKIEAWGRTIILIIYLCLLFFIIDAEPNKMKLFLISYLILLLGFQALLEWKYLRPSKQYIKTMIMLMLGVVTMYNLERIFNL